MNLQTLFAKNKKLLKFELLDAKRMQDDLTQGILDLKIYRDRITFMGKSYRDPRVLIRYIDIQSVEIEFYPGKKKIKQIIVKSKPSMGSYYSLPPGPDL